jgi:hypothetical protein
MSFHQYIEHGWHLCGIASGKGPQYENWNGKGIPLEAIGEFPGAGLLHALSGTCAIDIDDMVLATKWLAAKGIDLKALLNDPRACQISSERPGRAKLLYAMKRPLRTFKPKGSGLELRCATGTGSSVQDVLPPSTHPITKKPYEWAGGILSDWKDLPPIPAALLTVWRELDPAEASPEPITLVAKVKVDLAALRKAVNRHDPNCEYDEWIKVAGQCNDATKGGQAGLDILDEWSQKATRMCNGDTSKPVYPGKAVIKRHYMSLGSAPGKHIATGEALVAELPPETDDYEIVPEATATPVDEKADSDISSKRHNALHDLLKDYVFLLMEEDYFDVQRGTRIGDKALRHKMTHLMPIKSGRHLDPVNELMNSEKTIVEAQAFHPGETPIFEHEGDKFANTFRASSLPEPIEPMKDERDKIEWLFNRIRDEEFREWLRQFYAHMVQHPAIKIRSAPLIWSVPEGTGKNTICHTIPKLLAGERYYQEVDQAGLNSDFNDYLIGKWVIALTEFRAGTRAERGMLAKKCERWVADDMLALSIKSGRGCSVPNHMVITASSNYEDAAHISPQNRKWTVHHLDVPVMTEEEGVWLIDDFLKTPRARAVLRHYFLNVPITSFNPNAPALKTKDRQAMILASLPLDEELLKTAWEQASAPLDKDIVIVSEVAEYIRRNSRAQPANERIGKILASPMIGGQQRTVRMYKGTYSIVILRNHREWLCATGKAIEAYLDGTEESIDITS